MEAIKVALIRDRSFFEFIVENAENLSSFKTVSLIKLLLIPTNEEVMIARDTLRLEMGYCLYGNDINDTTSPLEAGLGWITKFTKAFTNSENLAAQKAAGVSKKLVGFEMIDRGIPRHDYVIKNAAGHAIGVVTSGTQAPSLGKAVGLGYVTTAHAAIDSDIYIDIRNTMVKAKVVKFPFK